MIRNVSLDEISDGKLYELDDEFMIGCNDCIDCGKCCHGMGDTIVFNPLDAYRLAKGLSMSFDRVLDKYLELGVCDGIILPHIKLIGDDCHCPFLDDNGRCSVHEYRTDICRLFPLGRIYMDGGHSFFIQTHECHRVEGSDRYTVRQWINEPEPERYEEFADAWHDFMKTSVKAVIKSENEADLKNLSIVILNKFYFSEYDDEHNFYDQFYERLNYVKKAMGL